MHELFIKISSNFTATIDIEKIESVLHPIYTSGPNVVCDSSGKPHWQVFESNIAFSRNFYKNFKDDCLGVAYALHDLKDELQTTDHTSKLIDTFLNHDIQPERVGLIMTYPAKIVNPHVDRTRDICINIGLANSNTATTYVSHGIVSEKEFWKTDIDNFTMDDGSVYIMDVKNTHAVKSNLHGNDLRIRYIITYNMLNR